MIRRGKKGDMYAGCLGKSSLISPRPWRSLRGVFVSCVLVQLGRIGCRLRPCVIARSSLEFGAAALAERIGARAPGALSAVIHDDRACRQAVQARHRDHRPEPGRGEDVTGRHAPARRLGAGSAGRRRIPASCNAASPSRAVPCGSQSGSAHAHSASSSAVTRASSAHSTTARCPAASVRPSSAGNACSAPLRVRW